MAAPTNAAYVKKALANSEPSTHGTSRTCQSCTIMSAWRGRPEIIWTFWAFPLMDPTRTSDRRARAPSPA